MAESTPNLSPKEQAAAFLGRNSGGPGKVALSMSTAQRCSTRMDQIKAAAAKRSDAAPAVVASAPAKPSQPVPAPARPSLRSQAEAHRATKGNHQSRAQQLAAKAQKASQKARDSSLRADRSGKPDVAAAKDAKYRTNFRRSEELAIASGMRANKSTAGKTFATTATVKPTPPKTKELPAPTGGKPSLIERAAKHRATIAKYAR